MVAKLHGALLRANRLVALVLGAALIATVLFILGITRDEIEAADAIDGTLRRVPLD